jgi:fructokinase
MHTDDKATPAQSNQYLGAVEAGGSKFVCAIGTRDGAIADVIRLETRDPASTLGEVGRYFQEAAKTYGRLAALGVGAFGPLDLQQSSPTFGYITTTPKPGWATTDLVGTLRRSVQCPVILDTDVNAAALGEWRWGAGKRLDSLAYLTVGTGVGVGVLHHGRAVHGLLHLELGHTFVKRHPADALVVGVCPYHADCLEGLASGKAIQARTGLRLEDARPDELVWSIEADYLGQLCALLVLSHSPHRIVIGGGVMQPRLYPEIRQRMLHWLNGYIAASEIREEQFVTPPGLGDSSGIKGALCLAIAAVSESVGAA